MHFLSLENIELKKILKIVTFAIDLKKNFQKINDKFNNFMAANIFLEPSTRTYTSFKIAENKLGIKSVDFFKNNSSIEKNESLFDTTETLKALGFNLFVIRSEKNKYYEELLKIKDISIINAGDGNLDHPSQTILDLMTIYEHFGTFKDLNIAIIGDLNYSRVFLSNYKIFKRLKTNIFCVSIEEKISKLKVKNYKLSEIIEKIDVFIFLRVQRERHKISISNDYNDFFGLNEKNIKKIKDTAIILHPGPVNRDVEISSKVLDNDKRIKILEQVKNGIFARITIFLYCLNKLT
ncbi:aspartate carbamoyltransferase catalytic subunit [symbiont of Argiope bruennichi]|uniref:aspartate carbamoyltransferase catalytic subunit n=1 Tax=symbiont of Argiope bruennichi TaxID=2810479 RepID=UPI003DA6BFAB